MGSLYPYADPTIMLLHKIVRKNISIPPAAPADGMQPPTFNHGRITCEQTVISILKTLGIDSKVDNKRNLPDKLNKHAKETQIDGRVTYSGCSTTLHTNTVRKEQGLNKSYINIVNNIGEYAQQVAAV